MNITNIVCADTMLGASQRGLFANHQGSIAAVADATGNPIAINGYDSYGIPNETNIGRFQYSLPEPCWEHGEVNADMAARDWALPMHSPNALHALLLQ